MQTAQTVDIQPFFLESPRGRLFCLYLSPSGQTPSSALLYIPPFAEEMHKSRRMAALQARAFAAQGHAVLQIDLTGCGDSTGDFGDATWTTWLDDIRLAHDWLQQKTTAPIRLWGLRTGALLAAESAQQLPNIHSLLLWHPISSGEAFLNQFLRIRLASEVLNNRPTQTDTQAMRARLGSGQAIDVAGYLLNPAMARELSQRSLLEMRPPCRVNWIEVSAAADPALAPASQKQLEAWLAAGIRVQANAVSCPPFWATQEICECPALVDASLAALES